MYRVNASALNLRATPSKTGTRLATLPRDALVSGIDEAAPTPGWLKVSWNGTSGFASAQFLEQSAASSPGTLPGASLELPPVVPATDPSRRDNDMAKLHPVVRGKVQATVDALNTQGIPFRVFEAFRTPERQAYLYAQGRTSPGKIVTRAQAWQSMHQYGLAVDLVLFFNGKWSWDGKPSDWTTMHQVAEQNGLQFLSFEAPHVELAGADWHSYLVGNFPPDGDQSWYDAVMGAAERWKLRRGTPPGPEPAPAERPPLQDQTV